MIKIFIENIDGKCFNVKMELNLVYFATVKGLTSDMFSCTVAARQKENMSHFLFTLYL